MMYSEIDCKSDSIQAEALERLNAMKRQERLTERRNYFIDLDQQVVESKKSYTDAKCRTDMIEWELKVAGYFNFDISTVFHSVSYLDRYLSKSNESSTEALRSRHIYQLVCMTCFYIAIKLHEPKVLGLMFLVELSQHSFTKEDFKKMESKILFALNFQMMTPTPVCFARAYLDLRDFKYPNGIADIIRKEVISDISSLLGDVAFITSKYSDIAISAIEKYAIDTNRSDKQMPCESVSVVYHRSQDILSH